MSGRIERIVVPFGATSDTRGLRRRGPPGCPPRAAARVFTDEDLLHLADLPFARQVTVTP